MAEVQAMPLGESVRINYPHLCLIELKGDVQQKLAVSGSIKFEAIKSRIHTLPNSSKSIYLMIRKGLRTKIVAMSSTIKEVHDRFHDSDGYLRIYVREQAAF